MRSRDAFAFAAIVVASIVAAPFVRAQPAPFVDFKAEDIDKSLKVGYGLVIANMNGDDKPDVLVAQPAVTWTGAIATKLADPRFAGAEFGISVWVEGFGEIVTRAPDRLLLPASNQKLWTAAGIHLSLPPDFTFRTQLMTTGTVRDGVLSGDLYVIATPGARLPKLDGAIFSYPEVAADLRRLGIENLQDIEAMRIAGRGVLGPLFDLGPAPPNSDYFPILDQRAPRARFRGDQVFELREMRDALEPVLALLDGETRTPLERIKTTARTQPPRVGRAAGASEALAVMQGSSPASAVHLSAGRRANALAARALASNCRGSEALFVNAVTDVVHTASPHL
jgi:hypothetical protein